MHYRSMLVIRAKPGMRQAMADFFVVRRVIDECRESIPGFISGELMLSCDEPDLACVTVQWADEASFRQWLSSPVRARQLQDLLPYFAGSPSSRLFETVRTMRRWESDHPPACPDASFAS